MAAFEKPAVTRVTVLEPIARRWSPRAFGKGAPTREDLLGLFEAARWTASSGNFQPWRFVALRKKEDADAFQKLFACLNAANQRWVAQAPVLLLTAARTTVETTGKPNRWAWYDVGQAASALAIEATARGLVVHPMAGFDGAKARETLGIPAEFEPVTMIAIGRPGHPDLLPPDLAERERQERKRKQLEEIVFGAWDTAAPFLS